MNVICIDEGFFIDKKYLDNTFILNGDYYTCKQDILKAVAIDENECQFDSENESFEESDEEID